MKTIKYLTYTILFGILAFLFTSCVIVTKGDNGLHKGWYKGAHHPGKSRGRH
jgi:hypothetical protein